MSWLCDAKDELVIVSSLRTISIDNSIGAPNKAIVQLFKHLSNACPFSAIHVFVIKCHYTFALDAGHFIVLNSAVFFLFFCSRVSLVMFQIKIAFIHYFNRLPLQWSSVYSLRSFGPLFLEMKTLSSNFYCLHLVIQTLR